MLERYVEVADLPAALRHPAVLELLGKAAELCWWDGFHRGMFVTAIGFIVLIGVVLVIRRGAA